MKRSKHSLSHYKLFTGDMGQLIPVACFEALPGDTIQAHTSCLLRVSPLLAPVMHPVVVRFHWWFVPNRIMCEDWEDFITGGPDGLDASVMPFLDAGGSGFAAGGLMDYLGVPPGVADLEVSAFPARAYARIFNENYRDQDLVTALATPVAGGLDTTTPLTLQKVAWEKDIFTAARVDPQKGPDITLPLGTSAPVYGLGATNGTYSTASQNVIPPYPSSSPVTFADAKLIDPSNANGQMWVEEDPNHAGRPYLRADLSEATAVDVNTVRRAFALQRYEEARAQYGSRFTEYLRYLGVRSSDARLQRPEYLGGGKQTIAFSEVLQSAPDATTGTTGTTGVGKMRGHGIAATRTRKWRRFFEEHGIVMCVASIRPRSMYGNTLPKMWSRTTKEDYWQRELERIGQQEIYRREIYAEADPNGATVFGYNDRYAEYRHIQSSIAGEFRTSALNFWHMARIFGSAPALNSDFVTCTPTDRVYASTSTDQVWAMASHSIQARRLVSNASGIGRII